MTFDDTLEHTKTFYPFAKWRKLFFPDPEDEDFNGMEQYTEENCNAAKSIFDDLIDNLKSLGEKASEATKIEQFKIAVERLNQLSEEVESLIETGEREDLCELLDQITIAAGLDPKDFADGEGIADEWRNW